MAFDVDSLSHEDLADLRHAAEHAYGDDTRHPKFAGHPNLAKGHCYVTSAWLKSRMGGHVATKDGHYFWLSPEKTRVLDLTGDKVHPHRDDYPSNHIVVPSHHEHPPGPVRLEHANHPDYKGMRVVQTGQHPRERAFINRANTALHGHKTADLMGPTPYTGETPEKVEQMDQLHFDDEPGYEPKGEQHFNFIFANGQVHVSPQHSHEELLGHAGQNPDEEAPVGLGDVDVRDGHATWRATSNVGLQGLRDALVAYSHQVGWDFDGLVSSTGQPMGMDLGPVMSLWYRVAGEGVQIAKTPFQRGERIYVSGSTAWVREGHPGLKDWATDAGLHLAEYPGGGTMHDRMRTREDLDQFNNGDPNWEPERDNPDAKPEGPFTCQQCGEELPTFDNFRMHMRDHEPADKTEIEDGHFPQLQDFDIPLGFGTNPIPNGGNTIAMVLDGPREIERLASDMWLLEGDTYYGAYRNGEMLGYGIVREGKVTRVDGVDNGVDAVWAHIQRHVIAKQTSWEDFNPEDRAEGALYEGAPFTHLYHVAKPGTDTTSIDEWGLHPDAGYGRVHLTSNPRYWSEDYWPDHEGVYQVNVKDLSLRHDPTAPHEDYYTTEPIGPERMYQVDPQKLPSKMAAGNEPKDMIEGPIPFVYDIPDDRLQIGYANESTHDVRLPGRFTPGGLIEGYYEPGGKLTVQTASSWPISLRHLCDLWYYKFPQMEITSLEQMGSDGKPQKLAAQTEDPAYVGNQVLYHGTAVPSLVEKYGLPAGSYLARDPELAQYYAEAGSGDGEWNPTVFAVNYSPEALEPDRASLTEPVGWGTLRSTDLEDGVKNSPKKWEDLNAQDSLDLVGTARHNQPILPNQIQRFAAQIEDPAYVGNYLHKMVHADTPARTAYKALEQAGGRVYVVGGAVRDALQGHTPKDIDLMVGGLSPDEVEHTLSQLPGRVDFTGKNFGVFRFRTGGSDVEIALPRTDEYQSAQRGKGKITVDPDLPVEKDLERRDFTANSMAVDLNNRQLIDPYGGAKDLERGVLRTTHPNAFAEDPTRLVRAMAAHGRFGLVPDERTRHEMEANGHLLRGESPDALNKVIDKMMSSPNPAAAIRLGHETGVLHHIFPEVHDQWDFDQNNSHHHYPLGEHLMNVLDNTSRLTDDKDVRMAAMMHDVGKPASEWRDDNGVSHYYTNTDTGQGAMHEDVGAQMTHDRMRALNYPRARIQRIQHLIQHHMFAPFTTPKGARKFIQRVGDDHADDMLNLREADQTGKGQTPDEVEAHTSANSMRALVEQSRSAQEPTQQSALNINGNDLIAMGLPPGPAVGTVLRQLTNDVIENPSVNQRDSLMQRAQQYVNAQAPQQSV